jgi:hypothetical protein
MTRPRLQLHLSTLLIVTPLAAGMVRLNVREQELSMEIGHGVIIRGWPMRYEQVIFRSYGTTTSFWPEGIILDVAVCLALLAVAAAAIEWLTRRMERGPLKDK